MKIRIHHFFDIIRDLGSGKKIVPHEYGHAYHKVAEQIKENANLEFTLVIASDEICTACSHLVDGVCDDFISHRQDFSRKEDFNNHLDKMIMTMCGFNVLDKYSPEILCQLAHKYIDNIQLIYEGNDEEHTEARKRNVLKGLKFYSKKHGFSIEN